MARIFSFATRKECAPQDWQGDYISSSDKADIVRAKFVLAGWKRDPSGHMSRGDKRLIFVFDEVRLKKYDGSGWRVLKRAKIDKLYQVCK